MGAYRRGGRAALVQVGWVFLLLGVCLVGAAFQAVGALQATPPPPLDTATPAPTVAPTPAVTPTPTTGQVCDKQPISVACFQRFWLDISGVGREYRGWLVPIALAALFVFLVIAFARGLGKGVEDLAKRLVAWLWSILPGRDPHTRSYLNWFILRYQDPKFGPRSLAGQYSDQRPARLEDIYLPIEVAFTANEAERAALGKDKPALAGPEGVLKERQVDLFQAIRASRTLVVIGHAGSGKSTLLQWAGLVCAHRLLGRRFKGQQDLLNALGEALFPIFVPLERFDGYCIERQRPPSAAALQDFVTHSYLERCQPQESQSTVKPPQDFFARRLRHPRQGCLLLFDGMDEVDPQRRPAVRLAVQEFIAQADHARTRVIITARPSAQAEAQPAGSRRGDVLPLDETHRDALIHNLYGYYEPHNARQRSADLIQRLDAGSPGVQRLAETPLLTTILTIIHRPGYELPYQRAEVYERAVETLLNETHRQEGGVVQADEAHKQDVALQRSRLGLIAFHLHQIGRGEQGLPENDLVEALLEHFPGGVEDRPARREQIRAFLYRISQRGGLLDERDCSFAFRTHRSFQEFLAGWHLARQYAPYDLPRQGQFIQERLLDLTWEEPVRLAAGYLAIGGEAEVNQFVAMVAGLGQTPEQGDHAAALAGLCLVDLPTHRVERALRERLAPAMLDVFQRNPPTLPLPLRDDLGRAIGELRDPAEPARSFDPRLRPGGMPEMVEIPAGPFRMGTSREDAQWLKENQNTETWDDEKPAHEVVVSQAYFIGRYPVTNREYRAFIEAKGYDPDGPWWSAAGRAWLLGEWQSDFSVYGEAYAEQIKKRAQGRARRDQPAFWRDRRWNGDNLPVVGVCWFEAEAYAAWLTRAVGPAQGRPKGWAFRLPSEAEWEKAARSAPPGAATEGAAAEGQKHFWPWGDAWDETRCNSAEGEGALNRTSPVGLYPHGASRLGCQDMAGNVWEWCLDGYDPQVYAQRAAQRAETGQPVQDPYEPFRTVRSVRGGGWSYNRNNARCAYRYRLVPDSFDDSLGFRLALSPKRF